MSDIVDDPVLDPALKEILDREAEPKKGYVYCAVCSHVVSHVDERIEVNGSHCHEFMNPHGFQFEIGCYRQALGCTISGDRTAADTWFMGYQWRYTSCTECHQHLGWIFDNHAADTFYGLILDRVQTD